MGKKLGRAIVVKWEDEIVNNITSWGLTVDGETVDVSDWDSGDWMEKIAGRKDWNLDLGVFHNPEDETTQDTLEIAMISGDRNGTISVGPETPATGDITIQGNGILSSLGIDAGGSDDPIEASYSIEGNGALTRNVETGS